MWTVFFLKRCIKIKKETKKILILNVIIDILKCGLRCGLEKISSPL